MDDHQTTLDLIAGATWVCMALIGLFFLRYHRTTRDPLFRTFAIAFWILAANRIALSYWGDDESRTYLYLVRLVAYLLILYAIWDKNRARA
jgi:hypothetical protein